ncbi:hypothetical protein EDB84DRAFT_1681661 [Lactarius hengduanensis]|nr:hypothetical protein EDB84DRAFT_1681661 [Lactarius hengduanensis]
MFEERTAYGNSVRHPHGQLSRSTLSTSGQWFTVQTPQSSHLCPSSGPAIQCCYGTRPRRTPTPTDLGASTSGVWREGCLCTAIYNPIPSDTSIRRNFVSRIVPRPLAPVRRIVQRYHHSSRTPTTDYHIYLGVVFTPATSEQPRPRSHAPFVGEVLAPHILSWAAPCTYASMQSYRSGSRQGFLLRRPCAPAVTFSPQPGPFGK